MKRFCVTLLWVVIVILIFGILAILVLLPLLVFGARRWVSVNKRTSSVQEHVGRHADVVEVLDWDWVHIELDSKLLLAYPEETTPFKVGDQVRVVGAHGAMLIVQPTAAQTIPE